MTPGPPPDDDRTLAPGAAAPMGHILPVGTRLEGFEIVGLIGEGGFGIVYLAYDASLERQVAIKEYMPSSLASRDTASFDVSVKSERLRETFELGLKSFVNEARLLARFDHPALVKVFRFWQAHRTAYMAMPFYEGPTLKSALRELGAPPPEALLREWLRPLLDALSVMHREKCYHRDIAPDNILLTGRGPLLLDFGAARRVIGDMTHALTVVLKPGYAPIEQYGESASMTQGPWTDLYALASVVHYAITGRAPIASVERMMGDRLVPLATSAAGRYSDGFLQSIDAALALRPSDRPQSVQEFRDLLNAGLPLDSPDRFHASGFRASGFGSSGFAPSSTDPTPDLLLEPTTAPMPATLVAAPARPPAAAAQHSPDTSAGAGGKGALLLVALALLMVAALVWFVRSREEPAVVVAPAVSPVTEAMPATTSTATPTTTPAATSSPAPTAQVEPPVAVPAFVPASVPMPAASEVSPPPVKAERSKPPRVTEPQRAPRPTVEPATPTNSGTNPARCSDILQKASLEPLTAEEGAYLKKACR